MDAEPGRQDGRLDHLLQLGMMVLFWHIAVVAIVAWGSGDIQQSLQDEVTAAMRDAGFRTLAVEVDGRSVSLSGEVEGEVARQRAVATAAMVRGTYLVDASELRLSASSSAAPVSNGPSLRESAAMDRIHTLLQTQVRFRGPNSSRLTSDARAVLAQVAAMLDEFPTIRGVIETRSAESVEEASPGIGERRADVVSSVLRGEGVSVDRIRVRAAAGRVPDGAMYSLGFLPDPSGPSGGPEPRPAPESEEGP